MRVELVNPFVTSAIQVFRTMAACELTRGTLQLKQHRSPSFEVSGLIGICGNYRGMVVLSLERSAALHVAGVLLGERQPQVNAEVADAIGELTNMVAGAAKAQLEEHRLSIGLPTVVCGKSHCVNFPSSAPTLLIPFESEIGDIAIEVGLAPVSAPVAEPVPS